MDNRLFFSLIGLFFLALFGWMAYDTRSTLEALHQEDVRRDLLGGLPGTRTQVQYLFEFPAPSYSHDLGSDRIAALRKEGDAELHGKVHGLTRANYQLNSIYELNLRRVWPWTPYLAWVDNFTVDFSFKSMEVFVSKDYSPESCNYRRTLEHEERHVEIHRRIHEKYQGILRETVAASKEIPFSSSPVTVASRKEARERIKSLMSEVLDPVYERFGEELAREQAAIDTRPEYERLAQSCPNW